MAQADLFDHSKPSIGGLVSRVVAGFGSVLGMRSAAKAQVQVQRRAPDPREAGYLADIGMEVG